MKTLIPASAIELEGPWTHRHVSAGGAAFHVADMGEGMDHALVLLHGFPEHWWAWRDVLPALAESTSRVFALDLRGFGTSDLTRGDCDLQQMANDVIGVVRALGVASFSVAGMGIGGTVAWMIGALAPLELRSVAVLSAPHPLGVQPVIGRAPWAGGRVLQGRLALPTGRERALRSGSLVTTVFRAWASPGNVDALVSQSGTYRAALRRPFAAHTALRGLSAARRCACPSCPWWDATTAPGLRWITRRTLSSSTRPSPRLSFARPDTSCPKKHRRRLLRLCQSTSARTLSSPLFIRQVTQNAK